MKHLRSGLETVLVILSLISISSQSLDSPTTDGCGNAAKELLTADSQYISARTAYNCLIDVPFQQADAVNTVEQLRLFLQFYSAQTYFANPPTAELELNPVNLNKTLDDVESNIKSGKYPNHYSFNRDLFNLFGSFRDGHVAYNPLCYVAFVFEHDYPLVSVAKTPSSLPEIHVVRPTKTGFEAGDKVVQINGKSSVEYLTLMANSHPELTWVDPDARFNQLLVYSFGGIYTPGTFAIRSVYETEDLILTWENGTTTKVEWYASLVDGLSADSFHSTDTFYKKVCVRPQQEVSGVLEGNNLASVSWSGDEVEENNDHRYRKATNKRSNPNKIRAPHPHRLLKRTGDPTFTMNETFTPSVSTMSGGEMSLYLLDDKTGVLVVSAFQGEEITDSGESAFMSGFAAFATKAISYLRQKNINRIIIDLSGNGGGFATLGENLAMQFFPNADHFFGSNMRWNPAIATMLTKGADPNATYWDLGHYHKMDGSDFASYAEFLGPVHKDGDYFTLIARPDTVEANAEDGSNLPSSYPGPQPFETNNIVILSSGMCASTCAVFAEALLEQGVHSVTFGGRPKEGPMQTVGGVKGSQVLSFDSISFWAHKLLGDDVSKYKYIPGVQTVATTASSINLRNSWRKDHQEIPIEFIYAPSEYRLSYTSEMITNQTLVWEAARDVVWGGAKDFCGGECDHGSHTGGRLNWSSLGELIWMKIDGHGVDFGL